MKYGIAVYFSFFCCRSIRWFINTENCVVDFTLCQSKVLIRNLMESSLFARCRQIAFKKQDDEERVPLIKDFHMDPEQRKFVFAEEYVAGSDMSIKSFARAQDRLHRPRRTRSRTPAPQLIKEEGLISFLNENP